MARILVIDDEKNIRRMVRLTLEKAGHQVEIAEDGPHGLKIFGDGVGWDLVLTDQRMPGLEGREVTREVRRRDPAARLVMMTSFATLELASDVLRAGATDFLRKPFSTEMLRGAIAAALARPRQKKTAEIPEEPTTIISGPLAGLPHRPAGVPLFSFYLNGYTFWPVAASQRERQSVQNLNVYRVFQVRGPSNQKIRCIVGVTPHIEALVRAETGRDWPADEFLWEMMCRGELTHFLWHNPQMPPSFIPIYELASGQWEHIHRLAKANDED